MTRLLAVAPNPSIDRFFGLAHFEIGDVNRPSIEVRVAGGKGLNVARVAAALGADVLASGILAGHAGRWIDEQLASEGIGRAWIWVDGETRSCIAIADERSGALTELNEAGPPVTPSEWERLVEAVDRLLAAGSTGLVAISGSLPPGVGPDGVAQLVERARTRDVRAIVDVGGPALRAALDSRPWLVKVNVREAHAAAPGATPTNVARDPIDLARSIARRTTGLVVITLGTAGAVAVTTGGEVALHVGRPGAPGPYPVGSGDAFLAGLAAATLDGRPFEDALRLAAGTAAANAMVPGAGRLDPLEAHRLAATVAIEAL